MGEGDLEVLWRFEMVLSSEAERDDGRCDHNDTDRQHHRDFLHCYGAQ